MIARAERNTQVTTESLEDRDDEQPRRQSAGVELAALKMRISAARTLQPLPAERHCLDCFQKGRDAALRVIDGE